MLYDISRRYPRAYVHRHKLHVRHAPFTQVGQSEIVMLVEQVDKMTKKAEMEGDTGNDEDNSTQCTMSIPNPSGLNSMTYTLKKVFTQPPHITADNFFSSEVGSKRLWYDSDMFPEPYSSKSEAI